MTTAASTKPAVAASSPVLLTLASGQFLMTLDGSVMNVSIAKDVGTTVTGIQSAITAYTLVMDDERTHGAAATDDDRRRFHRIGVEPVIAFPARAGGGTQDGAARNGHARAVLGPFGEGSVG